MSDKIWNKIQRSYEEKEERVSEDLWSRLETKLDAGTSDKELVAKTNSKIGWWKYAAVLLVLISVGAVLLNQQDSSVKEIPKIVENETNSTSIQENPLSEVNSEENFATVENTDSETQFETSVKPKDDDGKAVKNLTKVPIQSKSEKSILIKENPKRFVQNTVEKNESINIPKSKQEVLPTPTSTKNTFAEKKKYVKASDLLFERELNKVAIEQSSDTAKSKMGKIEKNKIPKPKNLKVFGVTVYEDKKE